MPEEDDQLALPRGGVRARVRRTRLYTVSALGAIAIAAAAYVLLGLAPSGRASAAGWAARGGIEAERSLALHSDSLALAIEAFDLRLTMMERRQMGCPELARGLVQVEDLWISYNLARRAAQASLDHSRTNRDSTLFAAVTAVEHRYERAGCVRP